MESLDDVTIAFIFRFIPLEILLQQVNRVCRRFNEIIETHSILWQNFEFTESVSIDAFTLDKILRKRARLFRSFCVPDSVNEIPAPDIDYQLHLLSSANKLVWLDLTGAQISTLYFLKPLKALEVLIIDTCKNISSCDVKVIKDCPNLEHLYMGYTNVEGGCIVNIVPPKVHTLECSGINFTLESLYAVLEAYNNQLLFLTVTIVPIPDTNTISALKDQFSDVTLSINQCL